MGYQTITDAETANTKDWSTSLVLKYKHNQIAQAQGHVSVPNAHRIAPAALQQTEAGYYVVASGITADISGDVTTSDQFFLEFMCPREGLVVLRSWLIESNGSSSRDITTSWYRDSTIISGTSSTHTANSFDSGVQSTKAITTPYFFAGEVIKLACKVNTAGSLTALNLYCQLMVGNPLDFALYDPP